MTSSDRCALTSEDPWNGWRGDDPPYHHPVFVPTRHPREPLLRLLLACEGERELRVLAGAHRERLGVTGVVGVLGALDLLFGELQV